MNTSMCEICLLPNSRMHIESDIVPDSKKKLRRANAATGLPNTLCGCFLQLQRSKEIQAEIKREPSPQNLALKHNVPLTASPYVPTTDIVGIEMTPDIVGQETGEESKCSSRNALKCNKSLTLIKKTKRFIDVNSEVIVKHEKVDVAYEKYQNNSNVNNLIPTDISKTNNDTSEDYTQKVEIIEIEVDPHLVNPQYESKENSNSSLLRCNECSKKFVNKKNLIKHVRVHTDKPNVCNICQKAFIKKVDMMRHVRTHTGEKPFVCNICNQAFVQKTNMVRHVWRMHTRDKPYSCCICDKSFTKKIDMTRHFRTHTGIQPIASNISDKALGDKIDTDSNMQTQTGVNSFACHICEKVFAEKNDLTQHLLIHLNDRPFACTVCGIPFTQKSNLTRHLKIHEGLKPFVCNVCERPFSQKVDMTRHMLLHSKVKEYACTKCDKRCTTKSNLTRHMKIHREKKLK